MVLVVDSLPNTRTALADFRAHFATTHSSTSPSADPFLDISLSNSPKKTFVSGSPADLKLVRSPLSRSSATG